MDSSISIRPVRPGDLGPILEIESGSSFHPGWTLGQLEAEAARGGRSAASPSTSVPGAERSGAALEGSLFLVAEHEGKVAGFAVWRWCGPEAELLNLGVAAPYRRRGVARSLLGKGRSELRAAGVHRVFLEVHADNGAARTLYERDGFRVVGSRRNFYNRVGFAPHAASCVEDALTMELRV